MNKINEQQNESHEDSNKEHIARIRKAMVSIEEEIKHIELHA